MSDQPQEGGSEKTEPLDDLTAGLAAQASERLGRAPEIPKLTEQDMKMVVQDKAQRRWGYMIGDTFIALPMGPLQALDKTPPFDCELPSGKVRRIVEEPQ